MSSQGTPVKMTSTEAAGVVKDLQNDDSNKSEASHGSRRSSSSRRSLAKSHQSVKSESLSLRKAALQAKQAFKDEQDKLRQEKIEFERHQLVLEQQQFALQQQQKQQQFALQQQQKQQNLKQQEIEAKSADLADKVEMAEIEAQMGVFNEPSELDCDSEISFKGLKEEKMSEGMQRFFDSQEKIPTPPFHPETGSLINPSVPGGWDRIAASMEGCLTKLTQVAMDQSIASNQLAASSQLPRIDVPIFSGDPLSYLLWRNAFDCLVDAKPISDGKKLNYLNAYVSGKPKEIVEHHLLIGGDDAYQEARRQLEERFGDPSTVGVSYSQKLYSWPKITSRDTIGLRDFADFLLKICMAKQYVHSLGILDFPQENIKLLEKLPSYLEGKWRDEVGNWRRSNGAQSYPPFSAFADFVKKAADRANIPELEPLSINESRSSLPPNRTPGRTRARIFATNGHPAVLEHGKHGPYSSCPFCDGGHPIEACEGFIKKPIELRKAFFRRKMLCFGCGTTDQHKIMHCQDRKKCQSCGKNHLSCLHFNKNEPDQAELEEGTSNCISVCSMLDQAGKDHCMIVPVWVRHKDQPTMESLEYAILDDQSNVSFIARRLCDKLNIKGEKTNLLLTTMHKTANIESERVKGLEVLDFNRENVIQLPTTFSRDTVPASRSQIPKPDVVKKWEHLRPIAEKMMPYRRDVEVSLLIGNDCTRAIRPREIITGGEDDPYAQRTSLGWGVIGRVCKSPGEITTSAACNKTSATAYPNFAFPTKTKEIFCPEKVIQALEADFKEENEGSTPLSVHDHRFLQILEQGITKRPDGHYEMPLPFKSAEVSLPNNRQLAEKRLKQLQARFRKNPKFLTDYKAFMEDVLSSCAEKAPAQHKPGRISYVPHTGVYHPKKPGKIRVVFDCSAKYQGVSLNDNLLQGPDLTNGLLGVLCRFRQEEVAVMADVKSMFHQFFVSKEDRDMLRFLWWEDGDTSKQVIEYRMMVHLFGAASSPSCANFGLKRAADDGENEFGKSAADYIRKEFYVDDGLKSVGSVEEAVSLMKSAQGICSKAGLHLHKIMSNKKEVLESFPVEDRAKGVAELNLTEDPLPLERALGVIWCVESDTLQFRLELHDKPLTRRGILSTVSSIYDPNGYVSPVTLKGKQILQQLCRAKLEWDSPIPEDIRGQWEKWRHEIGELENFKVPRCFKPTNFGTVKHVELHHFSDASQDGYGQCSYIRIINESDDVCCSLVLAKSRVTPLKAVTIPRLELVAATISAKMSEFLRRELSFDNIREYFWTDSKIVLGYINNEARRFHVYVSNRVQQIRDRTNPSDWFYIDTSSNPADDASRGLTASDLLKNSRWLTGPSFLQEKGQFQPPPQPEECNIEETDPEVKSVHALMTTAQPERSFEVDRLRHISSWSRAKKSIALCLKFKRILQGRVTKKSNLPEVNRPLPKVPLSVAELQEAEMEILRCLQIETFASERAILQHLKVGKETNRITAKTRNHNIKTSSSLYRLDPFIDSKGIIRVGGRINRANVSHELKHPAIMPRKGHLTELIIRHYHERTHHMGRGITHNHLRQSGYWVIGGSSAVSNIISKCVVCKKMRGSLLEQKMAELPEDRLTPAAPFTYCAVDYFGPFTVKERRSEVKRYGVVFTCMASRGIHLESVNSLTSSSFINCLRRFLSRRGPVRQIRSDRGTAFVGARNELRQALLEMDNERVQEYLRGNDVDWIPFQMNTPHSSHMGGVWERQIGTVRRALEHLLVNSAHQLDDESFRTFLTEVECIVNSRPLTTTNLCSSDAPEPLTPNHLLTMKPKIVLPPPGKFQEADSYSRKWWRRVQHLTNEFWLRWRKEFLTELQTRQKWVRPKRNIRIGDVVILKQDGEARGSWPLGRVEKVFPSKDGQVRKVQLMMADKTLGADGRRKHHPTFLERPIHKLVILIPSEETSQEESTKQEDQGIPDQGAHTE